MDLDFIKNCSAYIKKEVANIIKMWLVLPAPPHFSSCTPIILNIPTLTLNKNLKRATFNTSKVTAHLHPWVSSVVEVLHNCWKQGGGVHNVAEVLSGL